MEIMILNTERTINEGKRLAYLVITTDLISLINAEKKNQRSYLHETQKFFLINFLK